MLKLNTITPTKSYYFYLVPTVRAIINKLKLNSSVLYYSYIHGPDYKVYKPCYILVSKCQLTVHLDNRIN